MAISLAAFALLLSTGASPAMASFSAFASNERSDKERTVHPDGSGPEGGRTIAARSVEGQAKPDVDGRLDDEIWERAEAGDGFRTWDPERGGIPSEPTVFKVAFDEEAIYFAVACFETDPSMISKRLSRRDQFSDSDLVSIYLDPYYDRSTGYNFRVNPLGVQQDGYVYDDGESEVDFDWDGVWAAETYQDADGWYAEIRIPFSAIRYRTGSPRWGLQVYRYMHGRGEDTAWVVWDRDVSGFVSRFGALTGLADVPAPRQMEIIPYGVARTLDPAGVRMEGDERAGNVGADLRYGITADLTLNATFQPDFGQVEADPALLNLSAFETFFQEKRPFFVEGGRFFQHPGFNLFYSRRIGTGDPNSRIRYALKTTGKTSSGFQLAALAAGTDIAPAGRTHNPFQGGDRASRYYAARVGKEFDDGRRSFHVMQTAVLNSASREAHGDRTSREAYTSGGDFALLLGDRAYSVEGSLVGSMIDSEAEKGTPAGDPPIVYGTGGEISLRRRGGDLRGGVTGRWESDRLDLNDLGYLQSPDEVSAFGWIHYQHAPRGSQGLVNRASLELSCSRNWTYAGRAGRSIRDGSLAWSYGRGHPQFLNLEASLWSRFRGFQEVWTGAAYFPAGTQRYETRDVVTMRDGTRRPIPGGGPLMSEPSTYGGWLGGSSDTRKGLVVRGNLNHFRDVAGNHSTRLETGCTWNQSSAMRHSLELALAHRVDDTQHIGNHESDGGGIGGVSYLFAKIRQRTVDLTLRSAILFSRSQSLEIYLQPFLTVGDFEAIRELRRPDSYDLAPYDRPGFAARDHDFSYGSARVNAVYRWEYRPGSTFYLVWTQNRSSYAERRLAGPSSDFENGIGIAPVFDVEPENILLAKVSYWFAL